MKKIQWISGKPATLGSALTVLTALSALTLLSLFAIHYSVSELIDSLVKSSMAVDVWHPVIILPLLGFAFIQIASYIIFTLWAWFTATAFGEYFNFSPLKIYLLGLFAWLNAWLSVFAFNTAWYPHSFFSHFTHLLFHTNQIALITAYISVGISIVLTIIAFFYSFYYKRHLIIATLLTGILLLFFVPAAIYRVQQHYPSLQTKQNKPNIIFIGLDSLRPDFTHYAGNTTVQTPHIDAFLNQSIVFTQAWTNLARTFPSWITILTGRTPKHSSARNNLVDEKLITRNNTLAKKLHDAGYETIYATDEKRFSNITPAYGFDKIVGPNMGLDDFILGSLNDFPLTNLAINTSLGRYLFPYNYANRAAAITYQPDSFLHLIHQNLSHLPDKPIFLAVHFCISHWPYTWAEDSQNSQTSYVDRYRHSVEAVDKQLGDLIKTLTDQHILENSIIVLLSDHGTTLGLPNDRVISAQHYQGTDPKNMKRIPFFQLSDNPKHPYVINTSYGQGSDVLSLKQNHIVLAIQDSNHTHHIIKTPVSTADIAPSILSLLKLSPLKNIDGISLTSIINQNKNSNQHNVFYFESGYKLSEIETANIQVNKVVRGAINAYEVDSQNGLLRLRPAAETAIMLDKQYAVLDGQWLFARYPVQLQNRLILPKTSRAQKLIFKQILIPEYYVLVNLQNGQWTTELNSSFAQSSPLPTLQKELIDFYGHEIAMQTKVASTAKKRMQL